MLRFAVSIAALLDSCMPSCLRSEPPAPPPTLPTAPAPTPEALALGTVADLFGINEPVAIPSHLLETMSPEERDIALDRRIAATKELGARHIRVHSSSFPTLNGQAAKQNRAAHQADADAYFRRVLAADLEPLVMIGPWPGNAPAAVTEEYVPEDLDAYRKWVVDTVERYDGDGIVDASELSRGIHLWEVDNEPDLHNAHPPRGDGKRAGPSARRPPGERPERVGPPGGRQGGRPEGGKPMGGPRGPGQHAGPARDAKAKHPPAAALKDFETPEEYARVAVVTAEAIREADPNATVLPGGLWAPFDPEVAEYGLTLWRDSGFRGAFHLFNIHGYSRGDIANLWDGYDAIDEVTDDRPGFVTETTVRTDESSTERDQAAALASIYLEGLRRGVTRIYWHWLQDAPPDERADDHSKKGLQGAGLLLADDDAPGSAMHRWKLAAWVFHDLIGRWGTISRATIVPVPAEGAFALKMGEDVVVFSPTNTASTATVTLPDGPVEIACLVPSEANGAAVHEKPTYAVRQDTVRDGRLTVDLSGGPVRVSR